MAAIGNPRELDLALMSARACAKRLDVVARVGALASGKTDKKVSGISERDLQALEWTKRPVWSADTGAKSPPIFASFLRNDSSGVQRSVEFVQKAVRPAEVGAARVYARVARGFRVPATAAYFPETRTYWNAENRPEQLQLGEAEKLVAARQAIAKLYQKEGADEAASVLMFNEFIKGHSLSDYFRTDDKTYPWSLDQALWENLGEIAATDLIFGNTDRLARVMDLGDGYAFEMEAANLDNIRVKDRILYTIDNEFGADLSSEPEQQIAYTAFVQPFIQDRKTLIEELSSTAIKCIVSGLNNTDDMNGLEAIREQLNERKSRAAYAAIKASLQKGIEQTIDRLQREELPEHLFAHLPAQVKQRFDLLKI